MATVTLADLQGRLRTALTFPSGDTAAVSNADCTTFINLAKYDIQTDIDLYWCEKNTTYSLSAGGSSLGNVPSDYQSMIAAWYIDNSQNTAKLLTRINRVENIRHYPAISAEVSGPPEAILRYVKELLVRPKSDKAYTIQFDYWSYLADLSGSTDSDDITNRLSSAIVAHGAAKAARELFGWAGEAERLDAEYGREMTRWHSQNTKERVSGGSFVMRAPHTRRRAWPSTTWYR